MPQLIPSAGVPQFISWLNANLFLQYVSTISTEKPKTVINTSENKNFLQKVLATVTWTYSEKKNKGSFRTLCQDGKLVLVSMDVSMGTAPLHSDGRWLADDTVTITWILGAMKKIKTGRQFNAKDVIID